MAFPREERTDWGNAIVRLMVAARKGYGYPPAISASRSRVDLLIEI